ncbi:hypothetical protein GGS20DRAFT_532282 [Poronia punctata]|nr:hypothetical protein GGS20DRAFT_532282 [Poronia punctata]
MATTPFKVKALYEYTSGHEDDLPFAIGQIITVTDEEDTEWYGGEYIDESGTKQEGIFPRNFVEKFEPTAPPRPTRIRKKDPEPATTSSDTHSPSAALPPEPPNPEPPAPEQTSLGSSGEVDQSKSPPADSHEETSVSTSLEQPSEQPSEQPAEEPVEQPSEQSTTPATSVPVANPPEVAPVSATAPIESKHVDTVGSTSVGSRPPPPPKPKSPVQARTPPPVVEKPMIGSFRDRIAAFNKPAAPPVAPFKPSGLGSGPSGFIKKPFVPPPPSRNAYVPPPREPPIAKVYRREEDPEVKETRAESTENAEKAGLVPGSSPEAQSEEQPKPTTLKERIALLQKQQAEAAQRHAEAAAKKEKPMRPPKKRIESNDAHDTPVANPDQPADAQPPPERKESVDVAAKDSLDEPQSASGSLSIDRTSTGALENDGNEADMSGAGDSTEAQEEHTERDDSEGKHKPLSRTGTEAAAEDHVVEEAGEEEEEVGEIDPEVRRKEELRARMAKMSGGMGMAGMFGPPGMMSFGGPPVKKPKPPVPAGRRPSERSEGPSSPKMTAPAVPAMPIPAMMALPGMGKQSRVEEPVPEPEVAEATAKEEDVPRQANDEPSSGLESTPHTADTPPATERPAPPPIPTESRPPPPPPPAAILSPSLGSESDDELSEFPSKATETPKAESSPTSRAPHMGSPRLPTSPRFSGEKRRSYFGEDTVLASPSLSPSQNKRNSRPPPPIPGAAPPTPMQARPPPPPPPGALSRASTVDERIAMPMKPGRLDNGEEGETTEYEGDYDTDIASSAPHRDALKGHGKEANSDSAPAVRSPATEYPIGGPPPVPGTSIPRAIPPPIPIHFMQGPRGSLDSPRAGPPPVPTPGAPRPRTSVDVPRAAPPPPPPPKPTQFAHDEDYDPYNYNAMRSPRIPPRSPKVPEEVEAFTPYSASPPPPLPPSFLDRRTSGLVPTNSRANPRKSLDVLRSPAKRSMDNAARQSLSIETGFMASEIAESDLAYPSMWWKDRHGLPGIFQARKDVYTEINSKEDGKSVKTRQVTILFQDYSQTIITVNFDQNVPSEAELEQHHEPPPRSLRQDELEAAYERFGKGLARSVASKTGSVVGDGTPHALVHELLRSFPEALVPVGSRAYGALVYSNMANAATQLNDEIRPGDIMSIRNAKFQGKHGPMHAKYTMEIGKPDHVAIVSEWDGTKKKVRAWEQGRENRKVKQESFKLDDLRSGEVKIWRVMPRTWVGLGPKR